MHNLVDGRSTAEREESVVRTGSAVRLLGAVSATVSVAGGVLVAATYESLREGPLPIVVAVDILLLAAILGVARTLRMGKPDALTRVGSSLAVAALAFAFLFFTAVVLLKGLTDRVPESVAASATFVGSVATLIALPLGLVLVAVASLREARLPGWARPLPLVATALLVAVPVLIALAPEGRPEGQIAAVLSAASGAAWAAYAVGMASALETESEP